MMTPKTLHSITRASRPKRSNRKPTQCPICQDILSGKPEVKRHLDAVHRGIKPYKCKWEGCTMAFSQLSALDGHMNHHKGQKPYRCVVSSCDSWFCDRPSRRRHERDIHVNQYTYLCPECLTTIKRPDAFKNHIAKKHPLAAIDIRGCKLDRLEPARVTVPEPVATAPMVGQLAVALQSQPVPDVMTVAAVNEMHQQLPPVVIAMSPGDYPQARVAPKPSWSSLSCMPQHNAPRSQGYWSTSASSWCLSPYYHHMDQEYEVVRNASPSHLPGTQDYWTPSGGPLCYPPMDQGLLDFLAFY